MGHIHVGVFAALASFVNVIIVGFFWRWLSMRYHASKWAQAMAFLY